MVRKKQYRFLAGGNLKNGTRVEPDDVVELDVGYGDALVAIGMCEVDD